MQTMEVSLDEFCAVMILNKLPSPLKETLKRELKEEWLVLEELIKALYSEICTLEGTGCRNQSSNSSTATFMVPVQSTNKGSTSKASNQTNTSTQNSNSQTGISNKGCKLCGKLGHFWFKCFKYPDPAAKVKRAKALNLCTGCLDNTHGKGGCSNPKLQPCKKCGGRHFHGLCISKPQTGAGAGSNNTTGTTKTTVEPQVVSSVMSSKELALLPTIQVHTKGASG